MTDGPAVPKTHRTTDVAIISTGRNSQDTDASSMAGLARLWVSQDPRFKQIHELGRQDEFLETLRRSAGPNTQVRNLIVVAHGREGKDEAPYLDFEPNITAATLDLPATQRDLAGRRKEAAETEQRIKSTEPYLRSVKTKEDRQKVADMIARDQERLKLERQAVAALEKHEYALLGLKEVMAPGGSIFLLNCSAAHSARDEGPLVRNLARLLLSERGGSITAATGPVEVGDSQKGTAHDRDRFDATLPKLTAMTDIADVLRFVVGMFDGDLGHYAYIGLRDGEWVRKEVDAAPKAGLQSGRLFTAGDVFRIPAGAGGKPATIEELTTFLLSGAGTFQRVYCPPLDAPPPAPKPIALGSASIPGAGRIRYRLSASPPNPAAWTSYNSNAALEIRLRANGVETSAGSGPWLGDATHGEIPVQAPCTIEASLAPAHSYGPFAGEYLAQTAAAQLEFVAAAGDQPAAYGEILRNGDTISTGASKALLHLGEGSHVLLRHETEARLVTSKDGALRVEIQKGGAYVFKRPGMGRKLEFRFGPRILARPDGARIDAWVDEGRGAVRVEEGAVEVETGYGPARIEAGHDLDLTLGEIAPSEGDWNVDNDFGDWPVTDTPFSTERQSPVNLSAAFDARNGLGGWFWLASQAGPDGACDRCAIGEDGLAVVTVADPRPEPRLWRPLSGDFDVTFDLSLAADEADSAWTRFVLFAAGSCIGRNIRNAYDRSGLGLDTVWLGGMRRQAGRTVAAGEPDKPSGAPDGLALEAGRGRLRASRTGKCVAVSASPDGRDWTTVSMRDLDTLPETVWIGLSFGHASADPFMKQPQGNATTLHAHAVVSRSSEAQPAA